MLVEEEEEDDEAAAAACATSTGMLGLRACGERTEVDCSVTVRPSASNCTREESTTLVAALSAEAGASSEMGATPM